MKPFTLRDALNATGGRYFGSEAALDTQITLVTSDSRTVSPGALFIALKGARVDGHDFMADCLKKGAVCCLSEREPSEAERPAIVVPSTFRATGALAAWHRSRFDIPVIGITGSVGKTTTKEMISAVLAQRFNLHKTKGNQNNELGVPWTLMGLEDAHQAAVVEMGISDFGEMSRLTAMVRPSVAVFSVIGDAHLEFLGGQRLGHEVFHFLPLRYPGRQILIIDNEVPVGGNGLHDGGGATVQRHVESVPNGRNLAKNEVWPMVSRHAVIQGRHMGE